MHIIQNMDSFDVVIICLYCYDNPDKISKSIVLYFNPKTMIECVKQQNIKLYKEFDYPHKEKVEFSYTKTEEGFNISATITPPKK